MKNILLIILIISGLAFSQTGMLTLKQESSMGLWGSYSMNIDSTEVDKIWQINF